MAEGNRNKNGEKEERRRRVASAQVTTHTHMLLGTTSLSLSLVLYTFFDALQTLRNNHLLSVQRGRGGRKKLKSSKASAV
jgi:hypothetical protein